MAKGRSGYHSVAGARTYSSPVYLRREISRANDVFYSPIFVTQCLK